MRDGGSSLTNLARRAAAQLLRLVPGSSALRLKRDLRDAAWLSEADAVIVSFPKSGRTFVRAMLARLYQRRFGIDERGLLEFSTLRRAASDVPRVLFTHAGDAMRSLGEIRIDPSDYAGKKVVLLARHPGDIAVSRYHHLKHRSRDKARQRLAEQPLDSFVWAEEGGIPSIVAFLNRFAALLHVTILRYEDFLADPDKSLKKLAQAIGLETGTKDIAGAVEFGSLANLRRLEHEDYFSSSRLRPARKRDDQSGKVRSGASGSYRAELDAAAAARVDAYVHDNLDPRFGYSAL
ncbi:MAG TPA: sulfotransferase domain-containing protein [Sphingomicrobium sp.]|nr:sulfotransferase domain-containing protein [Sphingomicrobium sp.]